LPTKPKEQRKFIYMANEYFFFGKSYKIPKIKSFIEIKIKAYLMHNGPLNEVLKLIMSS
jgi:hypothetical protein